MVLVVTKGLAGCGKSTLSRAPSRRFGWPLIDKDDIKDLLDGHVSVAGPLAYELLFHLARRQRLQGLSVICDSPLTGRIAYERAQQVAAEAYTSLLVLTCVCSDEETWKMRINSRKELRLPAHRQTDWEAFQQVRRQSQEVVITHPQFRVDPARPLHESLQQVTCWLESFDQSLTETHKGRENPMDHALENVQQSYDRVAEEYMARIAHELAYKPLDRELLAQFAARVHGLGPVCDLGCGPGHVTRYLHEHGASVSGIDLSPGLVERAPQNNPGLEFRQGNMAELTIDDASQAGIVAFYSLIHFQRSQIVPVLQEFYRVLQPGGLLLLAFHQGQEIRHIQEWWGQPVELDGVFFERAEMEDYLGSAGFTIEAGVVRAPYAEIEVQTQRVYLLARKPL
jgi:ubiquinone/menaquinone biosynthesis C-methylase UbiE/predicted kinase